MKYTSGKLTDIYFIRLHRYVKIGMSTNIRKRMQAIQATVPYRLELIRVIKGCLPKHEQWLHQQFIDLHIHSEWFEFRDEMLTIEVPYDWTPILSKPKRPKVSRIIETVFPSEALNNIEIWAKDLFNDGKRTKPEHRAGRAANPLESKGF